VQKWQLACKVGRLEVYADAVWLGLCLCGKDILKGVTFEIRRLNVTRPTNLLTPFDFWHVLTNALGLPKVDGYRGMSRLLLLSSLLR
jgi:hypothetical protein